MATAGLSVFVGGSVALLWIARPESLADRVPVLFVMQFNTALCFVLTGLAFALLLAGFRQAAPVLALAVLLFGMAALVQDLTSVDLRLDTLLIEPFRTTVTRPGHMAAGTAACFVLLALCILVTTATGRPTVLRILLAATVFMVASATLIGIALKLSTGGDWLGTGRMSPQTAVCFAAVSLSMIFLRIEELGYHRSTLSATLGATSYLLLLLLTLFDIGRGGGMALDSGPQAEARGILSALLVFSGIVYACLIVYAFRSAQRYRDIATQLSVSQKRLAAIIDTAVDGFITIDERGTILSANPATEAIFGYSAEAMLGRNVRMLMPEPYRAEHDGYMDNYNRTHQPKIIGIGREVQGLRKNGTVFPLDLAVARIALENQVLYSGIVRDISQRKRHEREILEATAEMEEFSYRTSHDLRSPIASSLGLVAIMRDMIGRGASVGEVEPLVERMESGLQKLDRLIQAIIQLTRTKVLDEPVVPLPVEPLVRETIERLRFIDAGRRIAFGVTIPEGLSVETKASRFQMILDNLVSNAIKYADPKADPPRIDIEAIILGTTLELTVSDNGLGIDPRDRPNLFQMFRRFHPGHSYGSGLGLYILRKSADHLGGTVDYHSLDTGSRFVVRLPQKETE